jgi:hypothetical protein
MSLPADLVPATAATSGLGGSGYKHLSQDDLPSSEWGAVSRAIQKLRSMRPKIAIYYSPYRGRLSFPEGDKFNSVG